VLFSTPEARAVVIDLAPEEQMRDHHVRERALLQVLRGVVEMTGSDRPTVCIEGTLVVFEPGERHALRALEPARLLLTLAPWPGAGHYDPAEDENPHELPLNATLRPSEA
jgi:quercetin dioxygenase-like cupin family protein